MNVVVRSVLEEFSMRADPRTPTKEIFSMICKSLGIQETWYFGLMYFGPDNEEIWVEESKKRLSDLKSNCSNLHFRVKYYPEDIGEELIQAVTVEFFYLQVKSLILKDEIYCPADTCGLLASYCLQVKNGDYDKDKHNEDVLKSQKLLPDRVIKQYSMNTADWNSSIINMWNKHKGLDKEEAMLEYLKLVQNLDMYGITYFNIKNKKQSNVLLGVTSLGLNIYKESDKLNPTISFPWSEIKLLKFKDTKFMIKPTDKSVKDFVIFTQSPKMSKIILNLGIGNHSLYVRRRKQDTPEIVKMKEKAREVRESKKIQRQKFDNLKEKAEQKELEYKNQIKMLKEEMEREQRRLQEANETIRKLQQQLDELQRTKQELEEQKNELQAMMERLEHSKNMEAAEKQKLEEEIRAKHDEVLRIQEEVEKRDAEARRLQEEVELARQREEEMKKQQEEEALRKEEEERRRRQEELEAVPDNANTALPELQQVNDQLKEQLRILQSKLEDTRRKEQETDMDKIHRQNLIEGRDKYKTLADIRRGNTTRRVEMFENM